MIDENRLAIILQEGEGLQVEFKESVNKQLDREIVAFANTSGGSIFIGINDNNQAVGIKISNSVRSQILDIAHNCDPRIQIELLIDKAKGVIEIKVQEGPDKPYRCKDGFYVRQGACTQKLKRDEILDFIAAAGTLRFDETINKKFSFKEDLSTEYLNDFLKLTDIKTDAPAQDILISLGVAEQTQEGIGVNNAGILFFAKEPQRFLPESYITAVRYKSLDRFSIVDKKEIKGNLIEQVDAAIQFVLKHMDMSIEIMSQAGPKLGQRIEIYDYPLPAIREIIINAVAHRDYHYDSSHIYLHMYPDRLEIENPGGLCRGLTLENVTQRSVRRNRLIADLLYRARYIEKIGSGFARIKNTLADNQNPPYELSATNFFSLKLYKRVKELGTTKLNQRQLQLLNILRQAGAMATKAIAESMQVSHDTALAELRVLIEAGLVVKTGQGKATRYELPQSSQ